jgi:hypothetical protein
VDFSGVDIQGQAFEDGFVVYGYVEIFYAEHTFSHLSF